MFHSQEQGWFTNYIDNTDDDRWPLRMKACHRNHRYKINFYQGKRIIDTRRLELLQQFLFICGFSYISSSSLTERRTASHQENSKRWRRSAVTIACLVSIVSMIAVAGLGVYGLCILDVYGRIAKFLFTNLFGPSTVVLLIINTICSNFSWLCFCCCFWSPNK